MWLIALALLPLALLWLYGAVQVSAPFGVLALLFHEPCTSPWQRRPGDPRSC
jgi:hypothetical protein